MKDEPNILKVWGTGMKKNVKMQASVTDFADGGDCYEGLAADFTDDKDCTRSYECI